jgi:hypothetical protein
MNLKKIIWILSSIALVEMTKRAYIFDLDDTLIKTKAKIYLFNPKNELVKAFTSAQLRDNKQKVNKKLEKGYLLNFDEIGEDPDLSYEYLREGKPILKYMNLFLDYYKKNPHDVYIITGRGNPPIIIQRVLREKYDVELPLDHIMTVAHKETFEKCKKKIKQVYEQHPLYESFSLQDSPLASIHKKKKVCLFRILMNGYDELEFYDDDEDNIMEIEELQNDIHAYPPFSHIKIITHLAQE